MRFELYLHFPNGLTFRDEDHTDGCLYPQRTMCFTREIPGRFVSKFIALPGFEAPSIERHELPSSFELIDDDPDHPTTRSYQEAPLYWVEAGELVQYENEVRERRDRAIMEYLRSLPRDFPVIPVLIEL